VICRLGQEQTDGVEIGGHGRTIAPARMSRHHTVRTIEP
jgi:hypothetical protein